MPRKGRRRTTTRTRTGRAVATRHSITTPEIETMRRGILGDHDKHSQDWRTDQRLGSTWGRMQRRGLLTERQFQAAEAVASLLRAWARDADCPPRHAKAADLPIAMAPELHEMSRDERLALIQRAMDDEVDRWHRLNGAVKALRDAIIVVPNHMLAWSMIQSVCGDDIMPPRLEQSGPLAEKCWAALRGALDAAAGLFKIPEAKEAA